MKNIRLLVVIVFVVTLGAGIVAGLLAARLPASGKSGASAESPLTEALALNPEQREQMRKIWEGVRDISKESLDRSLKAESDRERAIDALIPPDKIEEYNQIKRNYAETNAKLKGRRQAAFEQAVRRTHEVLSESQRVKYDEILKKRLGAELGAGHDPVRQPPAQTPATQPVSLR
jgi:uncharacterized membrane protein